MTEQPAPQRANASTIRYPIDWLIGVGSTGTLADRIEQDGDQRGAARSILGDRVYDRLLVLLAAEEEVERLRKVNAQCVAALKLAETYIVADGK